MAQLDCAIPLLEACEMAPRFGFCYLMASGYHGTLYLGMTSDLPNRVREHKAKVHPDSFTARYDCNRLVWYERFDLVVDAIAREKQIKHWKRAWKIELIETLNPRWEGLPLDWTIYEK
ncbi:MAG: GIY-YIG nuclease family protein [Litorimonas sp.]